MGSKSNCVTCEITKTTISQTAKVAQFLFCDILFEWISWNSDKITIGKTRPNLVLVPSVSFLDHFFLKNLKYEIQIDQFQKNLQFNNFRNFRNCDLLENQIVLCYDCDRHSKNSIVLFAKLRFFRNRNSQFRKYRNPFYN